jgi:hypothetical protein
VPNSYGIEPPTLTDEEIRALLEPLIAAQIVEANRRAPPGLSLTRYGTWVGTTKTTTIKQVGKPDGGDEYAFWLSHAPNLRQAAVQAAQTKFAAQASQLASAGGAPAAGPAPGPSPPARGASGLGSVIKELEDLLVVIQSKGSTVLFAKQGPPFGFHYFLNDPGKAFVDRALSKAESSAIKATAPEHHRYLIKMLSAMRDKQFAWGITESIHERGKDRLRVDIDDVADLIDEGESAGRPGAQN